MDNQNIGENQEKQQGAKKERKKRRRGRGGLVFLHILQHVLVVWAAVFIVFLILGSSISLDTVNGTRLFGMQEEDYKTRPVFRDSELFNNLFCEAVSNLICYGAIRGQMETDSHFDGQKAIDVTAFADRYRGVSSEYITAHYYLEDLIKWTQNGFDYQQVYMTGKEADRFLSRYSTVTTVDLDSYAGGTVSYLNTDLESVTTVRDVSGNLLESGEVQRSDVDATILNNRYFTVEGKGIEDYVFSWDEYYELCSHVQAAAEDLFINYNEYIKYGQYYDGGKSNVYYVIRRTLGDDVQIFTNMNTELKNSSGLREELINRCDRYVFYDPMTMEYETNTGLDESQVRNFMNGYEYAYPEDTQVMIGVDLNYPVNDCFSQAAKGFGTYMPNLGFYLVGILACGLVYFLLTVILLLYEGRKYRNEEGEMVIQLCLQDRIPTEIMLVITGAFGVLLYLVFAFILDEISRLMAFPTLCIALAVILSLSASLLFSFVFYSLIRRIKAKTLWKNSLLKRLIDAFKGWILYTYDHSEVLLRILIPFALLILLNMIPCLVYQFVLHEWLFVITLILTLIIDGGVGYLLCRSTLARQEILKGIQRISSGDIQHKVKEEGLHGDNLVLARAVNSIGDSVEKAVQTSLKDERLKADLITNVSHDIKTPLTSIINYVDLIKREHVEDPKIQEYIEVLDTKSQRLKQLTDDLVEASKISSGNIVLQWEKINLVELLNQTVGEFSEKFQEKGLRMVVDMPKGNVYIKADSRRIWRVMENLFNNICKYALEGTRVYVELEAGQSAIILSLKNISAQPLQVKPEELTERFIRGDESRTTVGSGLGLSIAKNLTELQKGSFEILVDGDLFKVILTFPLI